MPTGEQAPAPLLGERVVFLEHFARGFGLPASNFFSQFLQKFYLHQHLTTMLVFIVPWSTWDYILPHLGAAVSSPAHQLLGPTSLIGGTQWN